MRFEPGFINDLKNDIESIAPQHRAAMLRKGALTEEKLISLVTSSSEFLSDVEHPSDSHLVKYDHLASWKLAADAVRRGEVAFVVLAGGAGSRVGGPKAFMRLPKLGMTLMANKLFRSSAVTPDGERLQPQTWFMTSSPLLEGMANHLNSLCPVVDGSVFEQFGAYRLTVDNRIDFLAPGVPYMCPTGHGDLGPALVESGLLEEFPNVKYCVVSNCDNVLGSLDLNILTYHIEAGNDVTCEVVTREPDDSGGTIVWHENKLQVVEKFRLSEDVYEESKFTNTNTMIINVSALKSDIDWRWHRVRKQVDNKLVVQYERLLQQYTESFKTEYVLVPRKERYLPVKVESDLTRADEFLNANKRW